MATLLIRLCLSLKLIVKKELSDRADSSINVCVTVGC